MGQRSTKNDPTRPVRKKRQEQVVVEKPALPEETEKTLGVDSHRSKQIDYLVDQAIGKDSQQKKVKTFELRMSLEELVHLRDVMSILLPPDGSVTLSQALAQSEKRTLTEGKLWEKITELCKTASVPLGDDAPDYVVGLSGPPMLRVYQLQMHEEECEE